jgi:hypothetical protein
MIPEPPSQAIDPRPQTILIAAARHVHEQPSEMTQVLKRMQPVTGNALRTLDLVG